MDVYKAPCNSTFGKPGQILHAQAREIVANVIKFMQKEAESIKTKGQPLFPFSNYKQRARMATGINSTLYDTIRKEAKQVEAGEAPCFSTPLKRKRNVTEMEKIYNSYCEIDNVMFDCSQCSHQSASIFQLNHHIQMKHVRAITSFHAAVEPEQFSCIFCAHKSHHQFELYEHFKQAHNLKIENMANIPFWHEFKRYPCEHCGYESDSSLAFLKHGVSCEKNQESTEEARVELPDLKSTGTEARVKSGHESRFKCKRCSYRANQKWQLTRHNMLRNHVEPEDWLPCSHCSYRAVDSRGLKRHNMLQHKRKNRMAAVQTLFVPS